ncbi:MAG: DUF433 domain-containing protein [Candidatus Sungiibacteriota bacterium]
MSEIRIIKNKNILGGKPVIEGTRIPVSSVLTQLKNGSGTGVHVQEMFPHLTEKQVDAALDYASKKIDECRR